MMIVVTMEMWLSFLFYFILFYFILLILFFLNINYVLSVLCPYYSKWSMDQQRLLA